MSRVPLPSGNGGNTRPPLIGIVALILLFALLALLIIAGYLMRPVVQGAVIALIIVLISYCVVDIFRR